MRRGKGRGRRKVLGVVAAAGLLLAAAGCANRGTVSPGPTATQTAGPCGGIKGSPHISKVVWIWFENKGFGTVTPAAAPYFHQIKRECGYASRYKSVTSCNSLAEYISATSGSPHGVCDNDLPSRYPLNVDNVFRQIDTAKKTWTSYQEGMTENCLRSKKSGGYVVRHNPAAYYTGPLGSNSCATNDVPLPDHPSFASDFTIIEPDLCHSMHDCPVSSGDQWLRGILPKVIASPDYQAGNTAVFITFDEGNKGQGEILFTLVLSRYTTPGTVVRTRFNHYSLLRTLQLTLGLPCLLNSCDARDMRPPFDMAD